MSGVPYTFATATTSIPLSQLDANFATNATLGNATVGLGNTTTIVGNLTLQNPTITGVSSNITFASGTNGIVFNNSGATVNSTLNDYETGTWTPNSTGISIVGTFSSSGVYTKVGRMITVVANFQATTSVAVAAGAGFSTNLPFPCGNYGIDMPGTIFKFGQTGGQVIAAQNDTRFYTGGAITATTGFQLSVTYFTA